MQVANARQPFLLVFVFAVVCVLTSMALVYTKHESRKLFVELEGLTHERDDLNIEWGQLQLEQSTLSTQARVELKARDQLGMVSLSADNMVIVKP